MGKVVMVSAVTAATVVEVVVMTKVVSVDDDGFGGSVVGAWIGMAWVAGKVGRKKVVEPEVSPEIERRGESSVCED
ncbi:hypothetical protein Tco_0915942 [Tanacetum coccineum]